MSQLNVKPVCAKLTRDTETFGNMDPYVLIQWGSHKERTAVHNEGGKFPSWKDVFVFTVQGNETMKIAVWDRDSMSNDDLVGETTIQVNSLMKPENTDQWFPLTFKNRGAGQIRFNFSCVQAAPPKQAGAGGFLSGVNPAMMQATYGQQGFVPGAQPPPMQPVPVNPNSAYAATQQAAAAMPPPPPPQQYAVPMMQPMPPQQYPPQQVYAPQPGYPPQQYPPQAYPPQQYAPPPQGNMSMAPQGYPPQQYAPPPQGHMSMAPQGYPPQQYPPQQYPPPPQGYQYQPPPQ